jgi:hypothetical protein
VCSQPQCQELVNLAMTIVTSAKERVNNKFLL